MCDPVAKAWFRQYFTASAQYIWRLCVCVCVCVGFAIVEVGVDVDEANVVEVLVPAPAKIVVVVCAVAVTGPTVGLITRERMMQASVVTACAGQSGEAHARKCDRSALGLVLNHVKVPLVNS
jgi:hypothetical protein